MMHFLKRINAEHLYYLFFTLFLFFSAIFCGYTRSTNLFHLSGIIFLFLIFRNKAFRDNLLHKKQMLYGLVFCSIYLVYFSLSTLWGDIPSNLESALTHSLYILIFVAMVATILSSEKRDIALAAIIFGFVALALFLIVVDYQNLLTNRLDSSLSPGPSNVIDVGGYFSIGVILSLLAFKESKKPVFIITASILFIALLLTQSRGPFIALMISLIVTSHYKILSRKNVFIAAIVLAVVITAMSYIGITEMVIERFQELSSQIYLRLSIWRHTFEVVSPDIIFGYGFDKSLNFINYSGEHITTTHSLYLGAMLKGGLIGLVSLLLLLGYIARRAFGYIKEDRRFEAAIFIFMLIFYVSQGMFNIGNPSECWYLFWFPIAVLLTGQIKKAR
ncbi:O-antigen ligase family protein [Rahnella sp. PCH160]|uniref:O-antigen ligase family protein n=1 Tax=Rahnella sp. PCH160 TaxID=3447928 RepID=UPI0039FD98C2